MPVPTPRARRPRRLALEPDAHQRLLRAAIELFERKGYASTSVREIVERAGVAKPGLYYYFKSKDGILIAALELAVAELDRVLSRVAAAPGSARFRSAEISERLLVGSRSRASLVRVANAVFFSPRESVPPFDFRVFDRTVLCHLRRVVADGVASGEIRPSAARDTLHAMQGVLMLAIGQHADGRPETVGPKDMRRLVDLVFDGAGVAPRLGKGASS